MDANSQSGKLNNAITEQRIEAAQSSGVPVNTGPNLMDGTTAFIRFVLGLFTNVVVCAVGN